MVRRKNGDKNLKTRQIQAERSRSIRQAERSRSHGLSGAEDRHTARGKNGDKNPESFPLTIFTSF